MAAEGHITFEELGAKLGETDEARRTAERELAEVEGWRERIEQLERDRDALIEHYAGMVPEALDDLTGEERHQIYRMLRLVVYIHPDGDLEAEGFLREPVCTPTGTPTGTPSPRRTQNLTADACNLSVKYTVFRCNVRTAVLVSPFKMLFSLAGGRIGAV